MGSKQGKLAGFVRSGEAETHGAATATADDLDGRGRFVALGADDTRLVRAGGIERLTDVAGKVVTPILA